MRRAWKWGMAAVAVAGVAGWPVRSPAQGLEWYTSPPVAFKGHTLRFCVLKPVGWRAVRSDRLLYGDSVSNTFVPPVDQGAPTWWPDWLKGAYPPPEKHARLALGFDFDFDGGTSRTFLLKDLVSCVWSSDSGSAVLEYYRERHIEFNATYRQICESFRVIREK